MIFSKSFGYTVRGILFITSMQDQKDFVQAGEIAEALSVPRHFMGKILKKLAKLKILSSTRGPAGGFTINENTLQVTLLDLVKITDGSLGLNNCVMRLKECNNENPCPLHDRIKELRKSLGSILRDTTIEELMKDDKKNVLKSLT